MTKPPATKRYAACAKANEAVEIRKTTAMRTLRLCYGTGRMGPASMCGSRVHPMCASTREYRRTVAVDIGGSALIVGHSMINTDTSDIEAAARQLARLHAIEDA